MPAASAERRPVLLIIRDGWGENPHPEHDAFNAVKLARTPVADRLESEWPRTLIRTNGPAVGLPEGTAGNSEVGHQNIGAGRIVNQELMRITAAIRDGSFATNAGLLAAFAHARRTGGCVHLLGLASHGRVHSDLEHLFALVDLAASQEIPADRLFVHAITDGRDTAPFSGLGNMEEIERHLDAAGVGRIASVCGRYYAMDRDHRWDRIAVAYACLTGRGAGGGDVRTAPSARAAVQAYYDRPSEASRRGDEFIVPTRVVPDAAGGPAPIGPGDAVIFFNYRGDRPREITMAFILDDAAWGAVESGGFDRGARIDDLHFCTLTNYEEDLPAHVAFDRPPRMQDILAEVIARLGLPQFRCAETEKFPHVTFFFNDYRETPFEGERRLLVPSPRDVTTYDQKPEMSAPGVAEAVRRRLEAADCEPLLVVNFANPDMVGHTGNLEATIRAVETVDACVGTLVPRALARGGAVIVTADHGNAEQMRDPEHDAPHTSHTKYDVPLIIAAEAVRGRSLRPGGRLADIAPTILHLMDLPVPEAMTGNGLVEGD